MYHFYDIDLSGFTMSSQFYIAFDSNMGDTSDYFYVDNVVLVEIASSHIAEDDFESGGWTGGSGWLAGWLNSGNSAVVSTGTPYAGSYHLRLTAATGYVNRSVNLSGRSSVHLQFQAKAYSFEAGETAACLVSSNGTGWTTMQTWVDGNDDNIYHFYDIDLSGFTMSSQFYIAFDANMSGTGDYLYIDNIKIVVPGTYNITSVAGDSTLNVSVNLADSPLNILSWLYSKT
jgi:hypothetical protein